MLMCIIQPPPRFFRDPPSLAIHLTPPLLSHSHKRLPMDLKNRLTTFFVLSLLFAMPAFSRGRSKLPTRKLNTEVYEIDYRGPETHSYMPPPDRSGGVNSNGGPLQNPKPNARSKRLSTETIKKEVSLSTFNPN
ncbi:hypothetical protein LXL04_004955 [Taraxacum kok-saghyz]